MSRLLDTEIGDFKLNPLKIPSSLVTKISNFCYRRFRIKLVLQIICIRYFVSASKLHGNVRPSYT